VPAARRFSFAFAPSYRPLARVFGVHEGNAWVEVGEDSLRARFGRWRVETPLTNIVDVAVTGPYRYFKTAGPARLGVTDRGLTFATNGDRGVLITFADKVHGIDGLGVIKHPELTVTVSDTEGLARALRERTGPSATAQETG
jgi:hypothetical protein